MNTNTPLVFAHIGDLHLTKSKEQNYLDYLSIIAQIETECSKQIDFVFLPGDNADNGLPQQYALVATALKMLSIPSYIIAGDHDMEQGSLENFYKGLPVSKLPLAISVKGVKCIFLDVCGNGKGGPDFRLGKYQLEWFQTELRHTREKIVLFMHTYPDDLVDADEKALLNELIASNNVLLVDMGHTHYNDISNDGSTIFSATRSTGQIEEGPVGYSLITIDGDVVSWRFKTLAEPFPFVMVTSPADQRLAADGYKTSSDHLQIRAIAFGARQITEVYYTCGETCSPLTYNTLHKVWEERVDSQSEKIDQLCVEAFDDTGRPGRHQIDINYEKSFVRRKIKNGSDLDSIGAWPENGIFGTQLGPNRNGKPSK